MKIIEAAEINYDFYSFPKGIKNIEQFVEYLNKNRKSFIPLERFETEKCHAPCFIEEDVRTVYINVARIENVSAVEAKVFPREEYRKRIAEFSEKKCPFCKNYNVPGECESIDEIGGRLTLDGDCIFFEAK